MVLSTDQPSKIMTGSKWTEVSGMRQSYLDINQHQATSTCASVKDSNKLRACPVQRFAQETLARADSSEVITDPIPEHVCPVSFRLSHQAHIHTLFRTCPYFRKMMRQILEQAHPHESFPTNTKTAFQRIPKELSNECSSKRTDAH